MKIVKTNNYSVCHKIQKLNLWHKKAEKYQNNTVHHITIEISMAEMPLPIKPDIYCQMSTGKMFRISFSQLLEMLMQFLFLS